MPIGDSYATLAEFKNRLAEGSNFTGNEDGALTNALAESSRGIDAFCSRQFNDAGSASARFYGFDGIGPRIVSPTLALVDDFHTTTGLVIATGTDGTFSATWTSADYELRPLNKLRHGETWTYWIIKAVGSRTFPCAARATLQVTARWGWETVPAAVKEACLIVAEDCYKLKDMPFGVAGYGDWGVTRIRENPAAERKLIPYRRNTVKLAA